jgi:DNA-binding MarR family transcriptional regulator
LSIMTSFFNLGGGELLLSHRNSNIYELLISLRRITRSMDLHSKQLEKKYGLTGPQLIILQVISSEGEIAIGNLAKKVSLSQATVTNIVERLEQKGILRRAKLGADKRLVFVGATEKAHELLLYKPTLFQKKFITEFEKLEQWEQTQMLSSLQRLALMLDEGKLVPDPTFSNDLH